MPVTYGDITRADLMILDKWVEERAMKHISRIDQPENNHHGWYVRIHHKGEYNQFFFSDKKHGGKDQALEEAQKKRDQLVEWRNEDPQKLRTKDNRFYMRKGWNDSTGVPGICRHTRKRGGAYYVATVCITKGKPSRKTAMVSCHGERGAFLIAAEFREEGLNKVHGDQWDKQTFKQQVNNHLKATENVDN